MSWLCCDSLASPREGKEERRIDGGREVASGLDAYLFSKKINGLLFGWTFSMYWPNMKSVTLPVPEIIGAPPKWAVPRYAHAPFSPKF